MAVRLKCKREEQLLQEVVEAIIADGGEGAILRRISSFYIPGRSPSLLKLKVKR